MNEPIDLNDAAVAIEGRRIHWAAAGFAVGGVTWRDLGRGWPCPFVATGEAVDADSVGVRCVRGSVEFKVVLFGGRHYAGHGSWADAEGSDLRSGTFEIDAPEVSSLPAFEELLDSMFERWSLPSEAILKRRLSEERNDPGMRRYWLQFDGGPVHGYGVTATDLADAIALIQRLPEAFRPGGKTTTVIEDVDIRTLPVHGVPNLGTPVRRGVWYPTST
jgi:hypothetical protein